MDEQIDALLMRFQKWFFRRHGAADARTKRRITGVALLGDTPPSPRPCPTTGMRGESPA
jgi:hypothetical protein